MMIDVPKIMAQLSNVNQQIAQLDEKKATMSHRDFLNLVSELYSWKRSLTAQISALRPVSKRDLRVAARYTYA